MTRQERFRARGEGLLVALAAVLVAFLFAPLLGLCSRLGFADFVTSLHDPLVWPALRLSLFTTSTSLSICIVFGTPLAFRLARAQGRLARALEVAIELPIVIPPAVAGVALLLTFGRRGILAPWLYPAGFSVTFTTAAVVMAEVFVAAPFFVRAASNAFRAVDPNLLVVARTLGVSPLRVFWGIALPLSLRGVAAGAALAWARSLAEFGATLMFAGNLPGKTQTLPLAIYTTLESDLRVAQSLSLVLLGVAALLLFGVRAGLAVLRGANARGEA